VFTATTWGVVATTNGQRLDTLASYVLDGTTFTPTRVCPASGNPLIPTGYTATANEIVFFAVGIGANQTRVFARQP
jgi:hypothetical protein